MLDRSFKLAVQKRLISQRARPYIEKPAEDPSRVRKGFFTREQVEVLATHLPAPLADLVLFLFFSVSAWRIGEARHLEWKHVFAAEAAIRLPAELHKNKRPKALPIAGDLAAIMERRLAARDLTCPYVFHRNGRRIGDFRKLWTKACKAVGVTGRIVHRLRRSGVKHLIETPGNDPHTVMAFSGHSTPPMLRRYHVIDLDVMRQAAERASARRCDPGTVTPLRDRPTSALPSHRVAMGQPRSRVCIVGAPARRLAHDRPDTIGAMVWERGGRAMYMNADANEFGAWPTAPAGPTGIRFSLFFPNPTQFVTANKPAGYGDPQIASIDVIGSFQTALGQQPFTPGAGTRLAAAPHASGKGTVYSLTTAPVPEGFYDYQLVVTFTAGVTRTLTDPCARWGGSRPDRSGVVVGTSPIDAPVRPVAGGRRPYRDLIVYELNIDDFSAELPGPLPPIEKIRGRVPYLAATLGVNAIEFLPWTAWTDDDYNWGYAPAGYFSVEHRYTHAVTGGEDTIQRSRLKRLISELHDRGVHVIMDGVFNHAGPGSTSTGGFAYRHYYLDEANCPYVGKFGGQFPGLLDLDYHNDCTQEFITDVCAYWMDDFGIDGIRYDNAINMVEAGSTRGIADLTAAVAAHAVAVDAAQGPLFSQTIEYLDVGAATFVNGIAAGSYWRDSLYQDCFGGLWDGLPASRIMTSLDSKAYLTAPDKVATIYLSNHDHSCVAWQAGARDNQGSMYWYRAQPYLIAALLSPGTPLVPNGQEFASDHWIPEDDHGSSRRITPRPLHWAYATDSIGAPMTALFQRLVGLRTGHPALRSDDIYPAAWPSDQGTFNAQGYGLDVGRGLLIFHRWGPKPGGAVERFIVVVNFSGQDQWVDIPFPTNGDWTDQLTVPLAAVQVSGFWLRNWRVPSNYGCVFLQ